MVSGKTIVLEKTLSQEDFDCFAELSGDNNPIHVNPTLSATTRFGRTVAHGLLLNTILRGMLDQLLPGSRQLSQKLMFSAPTYAGEPLRFTVHLDERTEERATVSMLCIRIDDEVSTCRGSTTVQLISDDYDA